MKKNAWSNIANVFGLSAADCENKYKNIRSSYGRYLKKRKAVPSRSGRSAISSEYSYLEWLNVYIEHRETSTNLPTFIVDSMNTSSATVLMHNNTNINDVVDEAIVTGDKNDPSVLNSSDPDSEANVNQAGIDISSCSDADKDNLRKPKKLSRGKSLGARGGGVNLDCQGGKF